MSVAPCLAGVGLFAATGAVSAGEPVRCPIGGCCQSWWHPPFFFSGGRRPQRLPPPPSRVRAALRGARRVPAPPRGPHLVQLHPPPLARPRGRAPRPPPPV